MNKNVTLIKDLKEIGKRYDIKVKVESITAGISKDDRQQGIISDESGIVEFVVWADSGKRYLFEGKVFSLNNAYLAEYQGRFQIRIDKETLVRSEEHEKIMLDRENIERAKREIEKERYELGKIEEDIQREKQILDDNKEKTLQSIKNLEDKKVELQHEKGFRVFGYFLFAVIIIAAGIYMYDFTVKWIIPKVNDIIELAFNNQNVPYKVVADDKQDNVVTLESIDKYKEKLAFKRPMNLKRPNKNTKEALKKHTASNKNRIYTYNLENNPGPVTVKRTAKKMPSKTRSNSSGTTRPRSNKQGPSTKKKSSFLLPNRAPKKEYVYKGNMEKIVYLNREKRESVLMELPGIGPKRVKKLMELRPFYSLEEILDSKIGIGSFWADVWRENIKKGLIRFD